MSSNAPVSARSAFTHGANYYTYPDQLSFDPFSLLHIARRADLHAYLVTGTQAYTRKCFLFHAKVLEAERIWELTCELEVLMGGRSSAEVEGKEDLFAGSDAVKCMVNEAVFPVSTSEEAVTLGNQMIRQNLIVCASSPATGADPPTHNFVDSLSLFNFSPSFRVCKRLAVDWAGLLRLGGRMMAGLEMKDRYFTEAGEEDEEVFPKCFVGQEAVAWMLKQPDCPVSTVKEAEDLGNHLVAQGLISYGINPRGQPNLPFMNDACFYTFNPDISPLGPEVPIGIEILGAWQKENKRDPKAQQPSGRPALGTVFCKAITCAVRRQKENEELQQKVDDLQAKLIEQGDLARKAGEENERLKNVVHENEIECNKLRSGVEQLRKDKEELEVFVRQVHSLWNETNNILLRRPASSSPRVASKPSAVGIV